MERKNKKYIKIIIITFIGIYLLSFCGILLYHYHVTKEEKTKVVRIGVSVYKYSDTFISTILSDLEVMVKEYEQTNHIKIDLDISDAKESQSLQNDQIERYIALGYDAICVNIVDRTTAATMIDKAVEAKVPLVFFNREPVEEDILRGNNVYYVGSDAIESAVMEGEIVVDAYKDNPDNLDKNGDGIIEYVMLEGEMGHQDSLIRTEWSVNTLKNYGIAVQKITSGIANFERNQAAALMEQWIDTYADQLELVICNNDDMALGACDALSKYGMNQVRVVGIDGTPAGLEAVKSGKMLGSVSCNMHEQADAIFKLAYSLAATGKVDSSLTLTKERYIRIKLQKITQKDLNGDPNE